MSRLRFFSVLRVAVSLAIAQGLFATIAAPALAWQDPGIVPITGADVVVAIDQSLSMSDRADCSRPDKPVERGSDPQFIRLQVAKAVEDFLQFNSENSGLNIKPTHRIGIIEFATRAETAAPLVPVERGDASAISQRVAQFKQYTTCDGSPNNVRVLTGLTPDSTDLSNTDFVAAIEQARRVFDTAPTAANGRTLNQRRILLFLTDGGPETSRIRARFPADADYFPAAFAEIRSKYGELFSRPTDAIAAVNIASGYDEAAPSGYWPIVKGFWESLAFDKRDRPARTGAEANSNMVQSVCRAIYGDAAKCQYEELGYHFVPPYLARVRFSFLKYDEGALLQLMDPNGRAIGKQDMAGVTYAVPNRVSESYSIDSPAGGCWKSEQVGTGKVKVDVLRIPVQTVAEQQTETFYSALPAQIRLRISDPSRSGQSLKELPGYPLEFQATLTDPSGNKRAVPLVRRDDLYQFATPQILTNGEHVLSIKAIVRPDKAPSCVSAKSASDIFEVISQTFVIPVQSPLLAFALSQKEGFLNYQPVPAGALAIELLDPTTREVIPLPADIQNALSVEVTRPDGGTRVVSFARSGNRFWNPDPLYMPQAGSYQLTARFQAASGLSSVTAVGQVTVTNHLALLSPKPRLPAGDELRQIVVELRDSSGNPFSSVAVPGLSLEGVITSPDGSALPVVFGRDGNSARYSAEAHVPDLMPGRYEISVRGASNGQTVFVQTLSVNAVADLPRFDIAQPTASSNRYSMRPLGGWAPTFIGPEPFEIVAQTFAYTTSTSVARFFNAPIDRLFVATVTNSAGVVITNGARLLPVGDPALGRFSIRVPNMDVEDRYEVLVRLAAPLKSEWSDVELTTTHATNMLRADPPLALWVWRALYLLLGLAALYGIAYLLWNVSSVRHLHGGLTAYAEVDGTERQLAILPVPNPHRLNRHVLRVKLDSSVLTLRVDHSPRASFPIASFRAPTQRFEVTCHDSDGQRGIALSFSRTNRTVSLPADKKNPKRASRIVIKYDPN